MKLQNIAISTIGALLVSACASAPPIQLYKLAPVSGHAVQATEGTSGPVQITSVHLPEVLDRSQLTRVVSANHMEIEEAAHWAAPLSDMVSNVLTQDLKARLGAAAVLATQVPAPKTTRRIVLNLLHFGSVAGKGMVADGSWSVLRPGQTPVMHALHHELSATDHTPEAQAQAMSQLLGKIADDIATGLTCIIHEADDNGEKCQRST